MANRSTMVRVSTDCEKEEAAIHRSPNVDGRREFQRNDDVLRDDLPEARLGSPNAANVAHFKNVAADMLGPNRRRCNWTRRALAGRHVAESTVELLERPMSSSSAHVRLEGGHRNDAVFVRVQGRCRGAAAPSRRLASCDKSGDDQRYEDIVKLAHNHFGKANGIDKKLISRDVREMAM